MLNWSDPNSNPIQDLQDAKLLVNDRMQQAAKEVSDFTDTLTADDGAKFSKLWIEAKWSEIRDHYPNFNLDSEAQKLLMSYSDGGEA